MSVKFLLFDENRLSRKKALKNLKKNISSSRQLNTLLLFVLMKVAYYENGKPHLAVCP